jgi:hypothetical protein
VPRLVGVVAVAILVLACDSATGGGQGIVGPPTDDPVGAVNRLLRIVQDKRFGELSTAVCADKVAAVGALLDPASRIASAIPGVDPGAFLAATTITFTDLRVEEHDRAATTATVTVDGTMTVDVDEARVRELLAPLIEQHGVPPGLLDSVLGSFEGQAIPITGRVTVIDENGNWLVCDVFQ